MDRYETVQDVTAALRSNGLEASSLILGIDATQSNTWTGTHSFVVPNLHETKAGVMNPYQMAISLIGQTLAPFDDDGLIPMFGFGDAATRNVGVFAFGDGPCRGFQDALARYNAVMPGVSLSGPTSFAPVIRKAIEVVRANWQFTILIIVADGQISDVDLAPTEAAIVEASNYPIAIVVVGVGDGPFGQLETYDNHPIPGRKFDNLQFVNATQIFRAPARYKEANFALAALQEVPVQYKTCQRLGLMRPH